MKELKRFGFKMVCVLIVTASFAITSACVAQQPHRPAQSFADFAADATYDRKAFEVKQELDSYTALLGCTAPADWKRLHPGKWNFPASQVTQIGTFRLMSGPWSFEDAKLGYVKLLCVKPFYVADSVRGLAPIG